MLSLWWRTAAWLLIVLDTPDWDDLPLLATAVLLIAMVALIAFHHRASERQRKFVMSGPVIVGLLAILVPLQLGQTNVKSVTASAGYWQKFDPAAISGHVAAG